MSLQAVYELNTELKRLSIASVNLAKGDFRLNKLIPIFMKSGESVPIFQKVASLGEKLISEEEQNRSTVLLDLLNIVNAIISTQTDSVVNGEFIELNLKDYYVETKTSFRKLKPVLDALENSPSGKMAIINEANDNYVFKDVRTVRSLIKALGSGYHELHEIAYKRLKDFGEIILDNLKNSVNIKEKITTTRIISLVSEIAKENENDFYLSFLNDEYDEEIIVAALNALKYKIENFSVVLEYIHHKKKLIRTAAYTILASYNKKETIDIFIAAYNNNERELIKEGINYFSSNSLIDLIISKTKNTIIHLISSEKFKALKTNKEKLNYQDKDVALIIDSLEIISNKKEDRIFDFYNEISKYIGELSLLENKKGNFFKNAAEMVIGNLFTFNKSYSLKLIVEFEKVSDDFFIFAFVASTSLNPKNNYHDYSKIIKKDKKDPKAIKIIDLFYDLYTSVKNQKFNPVMKIFSELKIDYRWAELFIELDMYQVVLLFTKHENKYVVNYLIKKATELFKTKDHPWDIIQTLLTIENRHIASFVLKTVKELLKNDPNVVLHYHVLSELPKEYAKEFEKLGNEYSNQNLTALATYLSYKK